MFISHNWLRELTGTKLDPQQVRDRLTNVGLAVDAVEQRGDDFVIDVEVPSNRGDCLSHIGVAREIAVIEKSQVVSLKFEVLKTEGKSSDLASVEILDPDLCPRYAGRVIRGVKIAPSPDWLVKKLESIGQRPINNVADITNYVLHEYGQPLHAFDLAKLAEKRIIVRRAKSGELIKTLDGVQRKLDGEMLVIADAERPVAVAGVMGGEDSEISDETTDVLIETAYFDPSSVRRTAKLLGLHTEASHRFERGTDPGGVLRAQERCVALICEIAGGVATEDALDVYPNPAPTKVARLRPNRIEAITGLKVSTDDAQRILTALGFERRSDDGAELVFAVPSWRHDVSIEEDLVEEVARHTGYDKIMTALPSASLAGEYHSTENRKRALRNAMSAHGYDEAISLSFVEPASGFDLIPEFSERSEAPAVLLTNPIIDEAAQMRQTLVPGLLNAIQHNINHGSRDVCLFELGRVFAALGPDQLPHEREAFAIAATGGILEAKREQADRQLDFFDIKGVLEAAIDAMNVAPLKFNQAEIKHLRPGQSARMFSNGTPIGSIGRLAETAASSYKFRQPVYVAEIDLTTLLEQPDQPVLYSPLPRFPAIVRDVSLLVDRKLSLAEILQAIGEQKTAHFAGAAFVGTYEGEGIAENKRSVTIRFEYRAEDRTLRDDEVDSSHWPLVEGLKKKFSAEVR
jgi:phenylalanyl-tRNA synthetase beta chain